MNVEAKPNPDDEGNPRSASPTRADIYADAEVEDVVRALRGYRVLTRTRLAEVCGASHWPDHGFRRALERAVVSGRVKRLSEELYEIIESTPRDNQPPAPAGDPT